MLKKEIIKWIGFDLDQTLYPDTPTTKKKYRRTAYRLLTEELGISLKQAEQEFEKNYAALGSGTEAVRLMGVKEPELFSAKVSNAADVWNDLKKDQRLVDLIRSLQEQYELFLITSAAERSSQLKLKALGLKMSDFRYKIFNDSQGSGKTTGKSFRQLLKLSKAKPQEHVYVGDRDATDIVPAKRTGMQTIMVWGKSKEADLSLKNIYELSNYL